MLLKDFMVEDLLPPNTSVLLYLEAATYEVLTHPGDGFRKLQGL
jgi:hypothetical protein